MILLEFDFLIDDFVRLASTKDLDKEALEEISSSIMGISLTGGFRTSVVFTMRLKTSELFINSAWRLLTLIFEISETTSCS